MKIIAINILIFLLLLSVFELMLRMSGKYLTYPEKMKGIYWSIYNDTHKNWYNKHDSGEQINYVLPEFKMQFTANNEGCRDSIFYKEKKKYRIIAGGDSFCEGFGTTNDSTWQKQLFAMVRTAIPGGGVEIWNAGLISSDPVAEYAFLRDHLIQYQPDLYIMQINATDIGDLKVRGGFERFHPNNTVVFKKPPTADFFYEYSHLFRAISEFKINNTQLFDESLIPIYKQRKAIKEAIDLIKSSIDSAALCCKINGTDFIVVVQPQHYEFESSLSLSEIIPYCKKNRINVINGKVELEKLGINKVNCKKMFWPIDTHFNNTGACYFAKALQPYVLQYISKSKK
jgi:hypothetical protein